MLDILRSLRSLLKISRIHTDGNIFRLHYSLTVIILMAFCIIITTKQYVGEPIDCLRQDGVDKSIINTYCWIQTTYSIRKAFEKKVGVDVSVKSIEVIDLTNITLDTQLIDSKLIYQIFNSLPHSTRATGSSSRCGQHERSERVPTSHILSMGLLCFVRASSPLLRAKIPLVSFKLNTHLFYT